MKKDFKSSSPSRRNKRRLQEVEEEEDCSSADLRISILNTSSVLHRKVDPAARKDKTSVLRAVDAKSETEQKVNQDRARHSTSAALAPPARRKPPQQLVDPKYDKRITGKGPPPNVILPEWRQEKGAGRKRTKFNPATNEFEIADEKPADPPFSQRSKPSRPPAPAAAASSRNRAASSRSAQQSGEPFVWPEPPGMTRPGRTDNSKVVAAIASDKSSSSRIAFEVRTLAAGSKCVDSLDLKSGKFQRRFSSLTAVGEFYGCRPGNVSLVCRGIIKSTSGHGFRWAEDAPAGFRVPMEDIVYSKFSELRAAVKVEPPTQSSSRRNGGSIDNNSSSRSHSSSSNVNSNARSSNNRSSSSGNIKKSPISISNRRSSSSNSSSNRSDKRKTEAGRYKQPNKHSEGYVIPTYLESICKKVKMCHVVSGKVLRTFDSLVKAGEFISSSPSNISACCRGRLLSVKGYGWKYAGEPEKKVK